MNTYKIFVKILDGIIDEAPSQYTRLYSKDSQEKYNASLSRAYIHMFLEVRFDLLDFNEREHFVTDGANDGGIDGYYIDKTEKIVYLIQSKFRLSEKNFREKEITLHELLAMDVDRIVKGEDCDDNGNKYNGKICQLQRELNDIDDLPRYTYKIIVLANLRDITEVELKKITGGYKVEVIDNQRCYTDFVFPIISGTYYCKSDLLMQIDLSNKAANKISYSVETKIGECDITVLFVPTIEVGKFMSKYKNTILKFNPRSYLGFKSQDVNRQIAESILNETTNEFALFNNGITLLSEETSISENVAQKAQAKLMVKNPQIINGGQTSFTLSRLYEDHDDKTIFNKKEVLLKIITLPESTEGKEQLIERISGATNHQTPVGPSDRLSNLPEQVELQNRIFDKFGMLYERKKGEFSDGISKGFINAKDIIDRSLFIKVYYLVIGKIASSKTKKLFVSHVWTNEAIYDDKTILSTLFGCKCYYKLQELNKTNAPDLDMLAKVKAMIILYFSMEVDDYDNMIDINAQKVHDGWKLFLEIHSDKVYKKNLMRIKKSGEVKEVYKRDRVKMSKWLNSDKYDEDIKEFFQNHS